MNKLEWLLQDMSYNSKFEFLDEGKSDELKKIAEKRGIQLPAHDLATFKCIYAFVDRMNRNKCVLPKEEVEKSLASIVGKAIDFDHFRKRVVGYWIDAKIEKDQIIAYGLFFKGNFQEDYATIKELMEKDVLAISFEAWGTRDFKSDGSYELRDIEFAGGALLLKEEPAFPGSEVLELAKKEQVLEFAKVMTKPEFFLHMGEIEEGKMSIDEMKSKIKDMEDIMNKMSDEDKKKEMMTKIDEMKKKMKMMKGYIFEELTEEARFYMYDLAGIVKSISEVECLSCHEKGYNDIQGLDFVESKAKIKCLNCEAMMDIDLTPSAKLTKKGRKIKKMKEVISQSSIEDVNSFISDYEGNDESLSIVIEDTFEESKKLNYKDRQNINDDMFAVVVNVDNKKSGKPRKIRMFPIHDPAHVRNALARLAQDKPQETLRKLGVNIDSVKRKILRRAVQLNMKNLMEKYKKGSVDEVIQEIAKLSISREMTKEEMEKAYSLIELKGKSTVNDTSLLTQKGGNSTANATSIQNASVTEDDVKAIIKEIAEVKKVVVDAKDAEIATLKEAIKTKDAELARVNAELVTANAKVKEFETEKATVAEAKRKDLVQARKTELGDFAKDMKDEDILDETKYEVAKLKKENAELKAGKVTVPAQKPDLTKGAADKTAETAESKSRKTVTDMAFGKKEETKEKE